MASSVGASARRNRVVARVVRAHRQQLRDVPAARAAVDAEPRRVAVPAGRLPLQPAHAVVGILHRRRIRRLGRKGEVDGHDQHAAAGERAIHRLLGLAILVVPGAAVQIEQRRERAGTLGPVDAGHQHPAGAVAPHLDLGDLDVERGLRIVGRGSGGCGAAGDSGCRHEARKGDRGAGGQLQELPTCRRIVGHGCLLVAHRPHARLSCRTAPHASPVARGRGRRQRAPAGARTRRQVMRDCCPLVAEGGGCR